MDTAWLVELGSSLTGKTIVADAHGKVHLRQGGGPQGICSLEIHPDLVSKEPTESAGPFSAKKSVPVLTSLGTCAPMIDPMRWGEFTPIKTTDQRIEYRNEPNGWAGTLDERYVFHSPVLTYKYDDILHMDYTWDDKKAQVYFSLVKAIEGGLTLDGGFLELTHGKTGVTVLTCEKHVDWEPGALWCRLPRAVTQELLEILLVKWILMYSFGMTKKAIENGLHEKEQSLMKEVHHIFLGELENIGFDHRKRVLAVS